VNSILCNKKQNFQEIGQAKQMHSTVSWTWESWTYR